MSKKHISISAEFFPPKTEEGARQILRTANVLKNFPLDFVSITYGAGGSSRERTVEYGELLREIFGFEVVPHLTCVGHSKAELLGILKRLADSGFRRIMALRGDAPKNAPDFAPSPDALKHASELISLIKELYPDMEISCAGYPEKHPEAASFKSDIEYLKLKTDLGAGSVLTQLFFNNSAFFDFQKECKSAGIGASIHAGVMPALTLKQARNFCSMCGSALPEELERRLEAAGSEEAQARVGLDWAKGQISELISRGVDGIHLYILNRPKSAIELMGFIFENL
ncbi:MAG: methylenetetrahydrofolate reductase [NAD(P)H] [Opitutales bacterium]|nr:methylenetetrahydrofolate reductase [NAD(P)H] [Opitutales bacterium]